LASALTPSPLASGIWRALGRLGSGLSGPLCAATLHGLALWLWHAPALFEAAVDRHWVHVLEHVCFFGTALLFWRAVLGARTSRRAGPALVAAFATFMHSGLLSGLITLAPRPLYAGYVGRGTAWGLTALDDQQLAGLLMWVPLGLPYLAAGLWLAWRFIPGHFDDAATRSASVLSSPNTGGARLMKHVSVGSVLLLLLAAGLGHTQDTPTAATGPEREESGVVQVGAGSRGDVTTGSSGGPASQSPVVAPEPPGFPLAPIAHPFLGPGTLEVRTPEQLRCELIGHENARRRCEAKAARPD
jgi:hypothetical protein